MCHHGLWGDFATSESNLRRHREHIMPPSGSGPHTKDEEAACRGRRRLLLNHLILSNPERAHRAVAARDLVLLIGSRRVCVAPFLAHWCVSKAQLWRYLHLVAEYGTAALDKDLERSSSGESSGAQLQAHKRDYVISWFINYAEETTERLPDVDIVSLPRMAWEDLYKQFEFESVAAGVTRERIAKIDHFRRVFQEAPELSRYEISNHKRNFGRCGRCPAAPARRHPEPASALRLSCGAGRRRRPVKKRSAGAASAGASSGQGQ